MFPEIFHFGPLHLRSFGVMLALAFLVGAWIALGEARRRGVDESKLLNLVLVILVSSIVGARGMYVLTHLAEFRANPALAAALWEGGLTLYGGFALGTIGGFAYMKRAGLPMGVTADVVTPSVALGVGIARIGCFLNGCCFGVPGHSAWCVRFPPGSPPDAVFPGQLLEPSQLYNAFAAFGLFLLVLWLRPHIKTPGRLWWTFLALFMLVRIPIDATRYYEPSAYVLNSPWGPITDSNLIGAVIFVISVVLWVLAGRGARRAAARTARSAAQ
jgi:phosphatidylglycerol---prolipoprotein diacylglyceryl transferase